MISITYNIVYLVHVYMHVLTLIFSYIQGKRSTVNQSEQVSLHGCNVRVQSGNVYLTTSCCRVESEAITRDVSHLVLVYYIMYMYGCIIYIRHSQSVTPRLCKCHCLSIAHRSYLLSLSAPHLLNIVISHCMLRQVLHCSCPLADVISVAWSDPVHRSLRGLRMLAIYTVPFMASSHCKMSNTIQHLY